MKLPPPPSLEHLDSCIPRIEPVTDGNPRPFWSVMIPTYNAGRYLRRALESVLQQDPGPDQMQIEVVDGCSTTDDPEAVVQEVGKGRVAFHRLEANKGGPHTFNVCLHRSRGHWVHVLHGDDMILPGFYAAYRAMIEAHPEVGMVTGKVVTIDEDDRWLYLSPPGAIDTPLIPDYLRRQAVHQQAAFPTVVIKRTTYEQVGGFCTWFKHCCDMDMWFRAGFAGPVARVPAAYGLFRKHGESDTNLHTISASNVRETFQSNLINIARLKVVSPGISVDSEWHRGMADYAQEWAWRLDKAGNLDGRLNQARVAWALDPTARRFLFLTKSWLKKAVARTSDAAKARNSDGHQ